MKKVTLFIIVICLWGITTTLLSQISQLWYIRIALVDYVQVFRFEIFTPEGHSEYSVWISIFFNVLLIVAALLHMISRGKETRLLRFLLAIIIFFKGVNLIKMVLINVFMDTSFPEGYILKYMLHKLLEAAMIYAAYRWLTYLDHQKTFEIQTTDYNNTAVTYTVNASKSQGFCI